MVGVSTAARDAASSFARGYFALQALLGAGWWIAVFASNDVRDWTLGEWDPAILIGPDLVLFVGASAFAALRGSRVVAAIAALWTTTVTIALGAYGLIERMAGWGIVLMSAAMVGTLGSAATIWFGRLPTRWFFAGPFSFRVADEASGVRHLRRSLAQLVVFWTAFLVVIPLILAVVEDRLRLNWQVEDRRFLDLGGAAVFTLGSVLGMWSCVTMALRGKGTPLPAETARHLVVAGPYRSVRNPMAVAGCVQTVGVGLWIGSWMVIVIAVVGSLVWNVIIRPEEEADLAERFGEPYRQYAAHVRCWIPTRPMARSMTQRGPEGSRDGQRTGS